MVDHYVVLGLPSGEAGAGLSDEEIKKAYRSKLLVVHRDAFLKLVNSYQVLKDPKSRKLFDDHLRIQRHRRRRRMMIPSSRFVKVKEEDIIDVESISKWKSRSKASCSSSSVKDKVKVKEEDIIDVESISKRKSRSKASCCCSSSSVKDSSVKDKVKVKEEDIIDVERYSISRSKAASCCSSSSVKDKVKVKKEEQQDGNDYDWVLRDICRVAVPTWGGDEDYTAERVYEIFGYFGGVEKVFIFRGGAAVVMASKAAAYAASNSSGLGDPCNPMVLITVPEYHQFPLLHLAIRSTLQDRLSLPNTISS